MKKIVLILAIMAGLNTAVHSQLSLNEIYSEPNCGTLGVDRTDWFELYNGTANAINLDCYRLVVVYQDAAGQNGDKFAYVLDFPSISIPGGNFMVFAGLNTFCYQGAPVGGYTLGTGGALGYNWNTIPAGSTDASLKQFKLVNGAWVLQQSFTGANDLFSLVQQSKGTSAVYNVFLYNGKTAGIDKIENSLLLGYGLVTPPADITTLPALTTPVVGLAGSSCLSNGQISFASIVSNEQVTAASGSDNGYYRLYNGICGTWEKGANSPKYTPGQSNNTTPPPAGSGLFSLTLGQLACAGSTGTYSAPINVVFSSSSPYGITYQVREDVLPFANPNSPVPGLNDPEVKTGAYAGTAANQFTVTGLTSQKSYFVTAINAAGCYSATIYVPGISCITLPVNFTAFTAVRNNSNNVGLKWTTATELNNSGFAVERNTKGIWEQVAFVPSLANGGNSDVQLTYFYNDLNTLKGISLYRIRQVDISAKSTLTEVRSVRGDGQPGKVIVYPNPASDGKINVVFESSTGTRNLSLMDMSGRIVKEIKAITNNNVQLDKINPGMYSLRIIVIETGEQTVQKIIVND